MDDAEWVEFRRMLREEWKRLWRERIDDKVRAEGIANRDFDVLFLDRGTVIFASRDARIPGFREILELWAPSDVRYAVPPDPRVGGWRKFIRTELRKVVESRKRRFDYRERGNKRKSRQLKKGGRGWLHVR
ncbi:MAG: hypothetical protein OEW62_01075 [Candidatus Bathyarchaeota archaeon]|nr:hypothetical protein [Candidatus Bathyarchaeota archaeon]MDH5595093.1 hypothetical protein [Candidatus Bathyarchaeota archaeon]